jgi:tRNA (cmo5U34)-methyltransferase
MQKIVPRYVGPEVSSSGVKMTRDEIRNRFDAEVAAAYSQRRPVWLPEYGHVLNLAVQSLGPYLDGKETINILDLGAGTGNLSRRILRAFPYSRVTLVDFSQNMLNEVPNVLSKFPGRYEIRQADFWDTDFPPDYFDAVVSSFALHHGRGDGIYQKLYYSINRWLTAPGVFVCCDVVDGDTPALAAQNMDGWRRYLTRRIPKENSERMFSNYEREDSPISLRKHLSYLVEAGFGKADILWKRFNFAVYIGIKEA